MGGDKFARAFTFYRLFRHFHCQMAWKFLTISFFHFFTFSRKKNLKKKIRNFLGRGEIFFLCECPRTHFFQKISEIFLNFFFLKSMIYWPCVSIFMMIHNNLWVIEPFLFSGALPAPVFRVLFYGDLWPWPWPRVVAFWFIFNIKDQYRVLCKKSGQKCFWMPKIQ